MNVPFGPFILKPVTAFGWTSLPHEAKTLGRFGDDTSAGYAKDFAARSVHNSPRFQGNRGEANSLRRVDRCTRPHVERLHAELLMPN